MLGDFGFRTAGFTSGGYLSADFGFDRGFDEFSVSRSGARSPFDRAARFLRGVDDERFFVFIHTDSIEEALMARFDLRRLAAGNELLTQDLSRSLEDEYLGAVSRLDREFERFFDEIGADGLSIGPLSRSPPIMDSSGESTAKSDTARYTRKQSGYRWSF